MVTQHRKEHKTGTLARAKAAEAAEKQAVEDVRAKAAEKKMNLNLKKGKSPLVEAAAAGGASERIEAEIPTVRALFQSAAAEEGADLSPEPFKKLVLTLMAEHKAEDIPTDKDLDLAFVLADDDKNGVVDIEEFVTLYRMIRRGEVHGLSKRGWGGGGKQRNFQRSYKTEAAKAKTTAPRGGEAHHGPTAHGPTAHGPTAHGSGAHGSGAHGSVPHRPGAHVFGAPHAPTLPTGPRSSDGAPRALSRQSSRLKPGARGSSAATLTAAAAEPGSADDMVAMLRHEAVSSSTTKAKPLSGAMRPKFLSKGDDEEATVMSSTDSGTSFKTNTTVAGNDALLTLMAGSDPHARGVYKSTSMVSSVAGENALAAMTAGGNNDTRSESSRGVRKSASVVSSVAGDDALFAAMNGAGTRNYSTLDTMEEGHENDE